MVSGSMRAEHIVNNNSAVLLSGSAIGRTSIDVDQFCRHHGDQSRHIATSRGRSRREFGNRQNCRKAVTQSFRPVN